MKTCPICGMKKIKLCKECGQEFEFHRRDRNFCSAVCKQKWWRKFNNNKTDERECTEDDILEFMKLRV